MAGRRVDKGQESGSARRVAGLIDELDSKLRWARRRTGLQYRRATDLRRPVHGARLGRAELRSVLGLERNWAGAEERVLLMH